MKLFNYRPPGLPWWIPIIKSERFFRWWSKLNGFGVAGMTLPLIILNKYSWGNLEKYNKDPEWYMEHQTHEGIHIKQQLELLVVGFFLIYAFEYLRNRWWLHMDHFDAYVNISFEREAYINDSNLNYLKERKLYGMWRMEL